MKLSTICISIAFVLGASGQCSNLVWSDEFEGNAINPTKWAFQNGNGCPDLCGWGNGELQNYTNNSKNLKVANGILTIEAVKETSNGSSFTSSKLRTLGLASWTHGRFEARMRMPLGRGLWPAFWMLSDQNNWPMTGEIDIMEYRGDQPNTTHATVHYGSPWPNNQYDGSSYNYSQNLSENFHVYAVEWEENEMRFYFDNVLIKKETRIPNSLNPPSSNNVWPWTTKFYMILNLAVGGGFAGNPAVGDVQLTKPTFEIDYVRVYSDGTDGVSAPAIVGASTVFTNTNQTYALPSGASYDWQVTGQGNIVSGQNTNSIVVNWAAATDATVSVTITYPETSMCSTKVLRLSRDVRVFQDNCTLVYNNFENLRIANLGFTSGTASEVNNPSLTTVNTSPTVLRYARSAGAAYDVMFFDQALISSGADFETGKYTFELDVYSSRPAGTPVEIQIASMGNWADAWPTGRHSTYRATTTKTNQWETLRFTFDQAGDPNRSQFNSSVDRIIVLLNPNSNTGDVYYIDNLKKVPVNPSICTTTSIQEESISQVKLYPLPAEDHIWVEIPAELGNASLDIKDAKGMVIRHFSISDSQQLDITDLTEGLYFIELQLTNQRIVRKMVKK